MGLLFGNYLARSCNFAEELNLKLRIPEIYQVSSNKHNGDLRQAVRKMQGTSRRKLRVIGFIKKKKKKNKA